MFNNNKLKELETEIVDLKNDYNEKMDGIIERLDSELPPLIGFEIGDKDPEYNNKE